MSQQHEVFSFIRKTEIVQQRGDAILFELNFTKCTVLYTKEHKRKKKQKNTKYRARLHIKPDAKHNTRGTVSIREFKSLCLPESMAKVYIRSFESSRLNWMFAELSNSN